MPSTVFAVRETVRLRRTNTKQYRTEAVRGQKGGCHGQPRLSFHGIARRQPSVLYALGWRSVLEALSFLERNTLRAREYKNREVEETREQARPHGTALT